ncbi:ParB/RepB/Spo0J family partition protein [Miltoncostaea marina]|uniref:ParB/RepB/Spo0J family partition protein n=1 Tax=Miltoncostaea marina TaxID=2843215 RepID=UPI001C3DC25E|nr:ParB/RepB/Spo0J family partition protein [Miltoncostaea marina]
MTGDTTTTTLAVLPIDAISVREGWNPRSGDDDIEHQALADSVRAQGILQPLLVERTDERAVLLDGHRRLAAARAAGITDVPVIERTGEDGEAPQLAAALAANMRRRGLDPIEEARAYERAAKAGWPQRRIAEAVGCSPRHVSQRLRLLRLPHGVQEAIGGGALPLSAVPTVETIAAVAPAVADALAAALATGTITAAEVSDHPEGALTELAQDEANGKGPSLVAVPGYQDLAALPLHADLAARAVASGVTGVSFSAEDMDAARAFGCLIEFPDRGDRYWHRGFVADPAFIADRVALHVERAEERARQEAERRATAQAETASAGADDDAAAESDEDRRRRERREAAENRRAARLANLDLGRRALLAYGEPADVTMALARAVALVALHHHAQDAAQGLRLTHERLQRTETTTTKAGATRERVRYPERHEAETALTEWIEAARTPAQVLGRTVQALLAAFYADQEALPQSERRAADIPGRYGSGIAAPLPGVMDGLARDVLPERLATRLRERVAWPQRATALDADEDQAVPADGEAQAA